MLIVVLFNPDRSTQDSPVVFGGLSVPWGLHLKTTHLVPLTVLLGSARWSVSGFCKPGLPLATEKLPVGSWVWRCVFITQIKKKKCKLCFPPGAVARGGPGLAVVWVGAMWCKAAFSRLMAAVWIPGSHIRVGLSAGFWTQRHARMWLGESISCFNVLPLTETTSLCGRL